MTARDYTIAIARYYFHLYNLVNNIRIYVAVGCNYLIDPKGANVFCIKSSVSPFVSPPQYTVQLVGELWLYTSSNVNGFEFTENDIKET